MTIEAPFLSVRRLSVTFGKAIAVADISLDVAEGECVAVVGANGAGKSTLGKAVTGLVHVSGGSVELTGQPVGADAARRGALYVPEGRMVFPQLTVEENLKVGAFTQRRLGDWRTQRDVMYDLVPRLAERARVRAGLLSGGEQQLLAIARALMARPRLLVLDEPSLGLSPTAITTVTRFLGQLRVDTGVTILLLEQNTAFAARLADRGLVVSLGRVERTSLTQTQLGAISVATE
ncbi:MAG: amino acid/amide transporter ATP-binding protein 2, family [Nocardioides sp.]|nr:amino acid/amide transporter ATP-binding protein 2, family [Nocardioides sp.]